MGPGSVADEAQVEGGEAGKALVLVLLLALVVVIAARVECAGAARALFILEW